MREPTGAPLEPDRPRDRRTFPQPFGLERLLYGTGRALLWGMNTPTLAALEAHCRLQTIRQLISRTARQLLDSPTCPALRQDMSDLLAAEGAILAELRGSL